MRSSIRTLSILSIATALATAALPAVADDPVFEIGGGVVRDTDASADVLVRVVFEGTHGARLYGSRFYVLHLKGMASVNSSNLNSFDMLDIEVLPLGMEYRTEDASIGFALGAFRLQRDVALDNGMMMRLALVGVRGEKKFIASPEFAFFVNGAADLLGLGLTKRVTDVDTTGGMGLGAKVEAGLEWTTKLRLAVGYQHDRVDSRPVDYITPYYTCYEGYDPYPYNPYQQQQTYICSNHQTEYRQHSVRNEAYLSFVASLSKNLSLFGRASYLVYDVSDEDHSEKNSRKDGYRVMLGLQVGL